MLGFWPTHLLPCVFLVTRTGPAKWKGDCQTGKKQTPIDIISNDTIKKDFDAFTLKNYDQKPYVNFTATNNGHSLVISFPDKFYSVSGGGLTGEFNTVQFHLHWGKTNMNGSEHFLDGKPYAAEVSDVKNNRW